MTAWLDVVLVSLVLTNLVVLGSSRLAACIRVVAVQGTILGALPLLVHSHDLTVRTIALAIGSFALKGVVFPWLLFRALRESEARREVEPLVGYTVSIFWGILSLVLSFWLASRLALPVPTPLLIPAAFSTIFIGLFLIVSRRKAITQVLGYLVMENGIYAFGVALAREEPWLVEMGVLLDVFVAVFVMGIMIFHISREFDHIDVDRLASLKDWTQRWRKEP